MKKTCIIIVTYNRKASLKKCLTSLLPEAKKTRSKIIVIDNNSTDGTKEYIKLFLKDIEYINTGKNLGGAGGFAFGINEAFKQSFDYAWLMDDDVICQKGALVSLIKNATQLKSNFSFLSSIVKWKDGTLCQMNCQRLKSSRKATHLTDEIYTSISKDLLPIETSSFVGFFLNLKLVPKAGLPIKEFFIYGDDWEYSERLFRLKPAYLDPTSILIHTTSSNIATDAANIPADRIDRIFYDLRNRNYIHRKHYGFKGSLIYTKYTINQGLKALTKSPDHKWKRIATITKGYFAGFIFNPKLDYPETSSTQEKSTKK